jgi:DNA-directed RNA polymerase subunit RPC12/RpoP
LNLNLWSFLYIIAKNRTRKYVSIFLRCKHCPLKLFANKVSLNAHTRLVHPSSCLKDLYKCSVCGYKTISEYHLARHVVTRHENKRNFPCPHCDYKSGQQPTLKRHVETVHTKPDNYKCKKCDFKTSNRDKFRIHRNRFHPRPSPEEFT